MTERLNRAKIEWKPFFTVHEYTLLDQILYRSNLTKANNGQGFILHVRKLAEETSLSKSMVSKLLIQWPFIKKTGSTKAMVMKMDYERFIEWMDGIVHRMDNDCPRDGRRSIIKEVQGTNNNNGIVHPVDNNNSGQSSPMASSSPQGPHVALISSSPLVCGQDEHKQTEEHHSQKEKPIVHRMDNKKSVSEQEKIKINQRETLTLIQRQRSKPDNGFDSLL